MQFPKASSFPASLVQSKIMGPNPLKLCEELLTKSAQVIGGFEANDEFCDEKRKDAQGKEGDARHDGVACGGETRDASAFADSLAICDGGRFGGSPNFCFASSPFRKGSVVLDLGSGTGITSALLAREYGLVTYAADLWSDPGENMRFFESLGLSNRDIVPVKANAEEGLPFASGFFDGVVSIDSYNYFGRVENYLDDKLLPYVKSGGYLCFAIPGMRRDCHADLPACLLLSWTPEQLDYMHDASWWRSLLEKSRDAEIVAMFELSCNKEAWEDWLACDNDYARGDAASVQAGALDYLNTIGIVLRKR